MVKRDIPSCGRCEIKNEQKACMIPEGKGPSFCPTRDMWEVISEIESLYQQEGIYEFARQASLQEAACYIDREEEPEVLHPVKPRLEEICEFADRMGYKKLGLAFCAGLQYEASLLQKVLEKNDFEVVSVICKVGCVPKENIGIPESEKVHVGSYESMCSPLTQAELLNHSRTEFNIIMGLCVGHDSLFIKHAEAMTTVFAVKDRVLGHNPLAALYTLHSYYQRYRKKSLE